MGVDIKVAMAGDPELSDSLFKVKPGVSQTMALYALPTVRNFGIPVHLPSFYPGPSKCKVTFATDIRAIKSKIKVCCEAFVGLGLWCLQLTKI